MACESASTIWMAPLEFDWNEKSANVSEKVPKKWREKKKRKIKSEREGGESSERKTTKNVSNVMSRKSTYMSAENKVSQA